MNFSCFEPCLDFINLEAEHCGRSNGKGNRSGILTAWLPEKLCYLRLVKVIMAAWCWELNMDRMVPLCATDVPWRGFILWLFCDSIFRLWASHSMLPGDLWKDHTLRSCWFWEIEKKWSESISKIPWGPGMWWKSARWPDVRMDILSIWNDICGCWVVDYCTSMRSIANSLEMCCFQMWDILSLQRIGHHSCCFPVENQGVPTGMALASGGDALKEAIEINKSWSLGR